MKKLDLALQHLKTLIQNRVEYPDAEFQTTLKFNVDEQQLMDAYDQDCMAD
jgi:hypothetical protein